MAKPDTDDSKPGKSLKPRAFPWRLWLFALAMTGATGLGANYAWQYRKEARAAGDDLGTCRTSLDKVKPQTDEAIKKYEGCNKLLDDNNKKLQDQDKKSHEQDVQMTALSNNLSASKDELAALQVQRAEAEKRLAAIADIQKQFAKMIDTGQLKVTARRGSLVLSLPSEVLFPSGSADLSESGKMAVLEVGFNLKRLADRRFLVVGHTDDQPLKGSTYKDNWELSTARAVTVTQFLVSAGLNPKTMMAAGHGEHDPAASNKTKEGREKNRRIEIVLLPDLGEMPPMPKELLEGAPRPDRDGAEPGESVPRKRAGGSKKG